MFAEFLNQEKLIEYITLYGVKFLLAIVILVVGLMVIKYVTKATVAVMKKVKMDDVLVSFFSKIVKALLMAFVIIASVGQLGVDTTSLAAMIAAAGLAIGLALQGSLSNFAAGVMIIATRPFKIGDYVEVSGVGGAITDLSIYNTILVTPDNKVITIPNSKITSENIINFSARDTRRVDMVFGISYSDDIKKAKKVINKVIKDDSRILAEPEPLVAVSALADSSVNFNVRPWVKKEDYWNVYFDMHENIKIAFDKEGITIPFPQRELHVHNLKK
ncbi:MAG: mechanosensitive ion channel [Rickettsiales bacterium]|nr:mechanosensitive ion channel [Pseudomonadota bacterium]MDA0967073.1 mechanosensitive ion channel [Pseudomonadota bacterium]MDG4542441.1 mechanosensitive ion channel [Rickettsiales bacterium]MDG4544945.1 mechanosensitive ion channel [Rickettsiales bacterium]MDG4547068.1 mechanosensitive ion channel [Rickettsiales bacterium]